MTNDTPRVEQGKADEPQQPDDLDQARFVSEDEHERIEAAMDAYELQLARSGPNPKSDEEQFLELARAIIGHGRDPSEWSEAQRLLLVLANHIANASLLGRPQGRYTGPIYEQALRKAVKELGTDAQGRTLRRVLCVEAVVSAGTWWQKSPEAQAERARARCIQRLLTKLAAQDSAFRALQAEDADGARADIAGLLSQYDRTPRGKKGKRGAESILAEIIVMHLDAQGALGLKAPSQSAEVTDLDNYTAIESIRNALAHDCVEFANSIKQARP